VVDIVKLFIYEKELFIASFPAAFMSSLLSYNYGIV